ncbi:MAG: ROK family protein [Gammaproteobacteria bacterium]
MRIGIDLGGTKIEGIALDDNGEELVRYRVNTPQHDYTATLNTIINLVNQIEDETRQSGSVGIGIPGAISPATSLVKNANSTWLIGKPLDKDLAEKLGKPVRIANDANCFVMSEATDGAGKDAEIVFGVIIGTGTGGGITINRQLVVGSNAIAGEWGHNPLPWPGPSELPGQDCYCGKQGCIETFLSGPGFARWFAHEFNTHAEKPLSAPDIVYLAEQGNQAAEQALEQYEDRMARALSSVINIIDPHVIVLGGGMSNIQRLYENVPRIWGRYIFSDTVHTRLLANVHGDSSGVRGAAWLWD